MKFLLALALVLAGCAGASIELDKASFDWTHDAWVQALGHSDDPGAVQRYEQRMRELAAAICGEEPTFWGCRWMPAKKGAQE